MAAGFCAFFAQKSPDHALDIQRQTPYPRAYDRHGKHDGEDGFGTGVVLPVHAGFGLHFASGWIDFIG